MPCQSDDSMIDRRQEALDQATRCLCAAIILLRANKIEMRGELLMWAAAHDEWDKRRLAKNAARQAEAETKQAALEKLTPAERRALGLGK